MTKKVVSYIFIINAIIFCFLPGLSSANEYTIEDLYKIAIARSERIQITEENLYIAETGKDKALSFLLPRVSAFGGYTKFTEDKRNAAGVIIQPENTSSWGVRVEETLSLSGRELTALKISRHNILKAKHDLKAVSEEFLLYVAYAYFEVLKAGKAVDITKANLDRLTKHKEAAEKRLKVGEVTKTVLLRAEGELSGAKSDYLMAKNSMELARATLARIVGISSDFKLKESPFEDIDAASLSLSIDTAFRSRADLMSADIQKKMAGDQVKYTKGGYWPTLSLSGVYLASDQHPATLALNKESIYGAVALNFPFFEGGLRVAEVREAKARERQSSLLYDDLKKSIEIEVQSAYLDIKTQKGILKFLEDQLTFAKDNYSAVSKLFEFGLSNSIDVMDANTLLVSSERKMSEAVYNYHLSILKMKKATGTLLKSVAASE